MTLDALPKLLIELRDDAGVAAIAAGRVRAYEPAPAVIQGGQIVTPADAQPAASYRAFVLLVMLDPGLDRRLPVQFATVSVQCYGRTMVEASALWSAVADCLHRRGTRTFGNGLGFYISHVRGGAGERDPDTTQPFYQGYADVIATTVAV